MRNVMVMGCFVALLAGCGDDGSDGSPEMSKGGAAGVGGGNSPGGSPTGGVSPGGTGGGSARGGAGGSSGGTGGAPSGGAPGSSTTTAPTGPVETCFGDSCPLGECDNGRFFAEVKCSDVYPGPVDENSMFCAPGADGGYCLTTATTVLTDWAINCSGGTPTLERCSAGCGFIPGLAQCGGL